jgi:hypothetical protein
MTRICNVVVLALLSILMVPAAFAQSASATVVAGSDYCREIHFPGGWKSTKGMQKLSGIISLVSFSGVFMNSGRRPPTLKNI